MAAKRGATRTRRTTTVEREPVGESRDPVAELLTQFTDSGALKAKLNRESEKPPRRLEYITTIEPVTPEFVDDVQSQYGGGTYKAHLYQGAKYIQTLTFTIAGKPKLDEDDRLARIEDRLSAPHAAPANGLDAVERIITIVTPLAAALIPLFKSASGGGSVTETLTLMQSAEEKGERRGRAIGRLESGEGNTMMDVAGKYIPPLLDMISQRTRRIANAPVEDVPAARTLPAVAAPVLIPEYQWLESLRPFYRNLAAEAEQDSDPEVIADFALTRMDRAHLEAIRTAAQRPDFDGTLRTELAPIVARYPEWITAFLARIVETATMDDEPEAPAPPVPKPRGKK